MIALQPSPMQNMAWTSFSFSPTGKRLACKVFVNKVFVYDVSNGGLYREISLQGLNVQQTPAVFSDDDHVLLGDHTLIDLESQVRLWQYQGNEHVVASNGVCWFEVAARQNQAGALVPARSPQPGSGSHSKGPCATRTSSLSNRAPRPRLMPAVSPAGRSGMKWFSR